MLRKRIYPVFICMMVIALVAVAAMGAGNAKAAPRYEARSGSWYAQAIVPSSASWSKFQQQNVSVATNTTYIAYAWIKGSGSVSLNVINSGWTANLASVVCTATSSWTQCTTPSFSTGSNSTVQFSFYDDRGAAGTMFIDDVFLGPSGGANKITNNPGFESGNTGWENQNTSVWSIAQGGGPTPTRTNTPVGPTPTKTSTPTKTNTPTGCGSTNIALNHTVTVSSVGDSLPGPNAVDGSTSTRWGSAYSDPQWIYVDLGASSNVCRVKLNWEAAYGKSYQIQTSNDASSWTSIYSTTTGDGGIDDLTGLSGSGRYVRMYGTVRGTSYGYSLWEFEVYSTGSGGPTPTRTNTPVGTTPTRTSTPGGSGLHVPAGWNLVFSDDFNSLNTSNWTLGLPPGWGDHLNDELECYQSGQDTVSGGILYLTAKQGSCGNGQTYPSGAITTKATYTNLYVESRIKVPYGKGFWPALWTVSSTRWPPEWDIFEEPKTSGEIYGYPHEVSGSCTWVGGAAGSDYIFTTGEGAPNIYDWVTYGFTLNNGDLIWYVNNTTSQHISCGSAQGIGDSLWVIINLAVGGEWPGNPDGTTPFPSSVQVDYVKIWTP